MRNATLAVVVAGLLCAAGQARAQEKPDRIARVEFIKAKPGMEAQLEAAGKKHFGWHKVHGDTWTIYLWQVITGDNAGSYYLGTFNHAWKEFDAREAFDVADDQDAMAAVGPYLQSDTPSLWRLVEDASRSDEQLKGPAKFTQLTHYYVKPGRLSAFTDAIKEIKAALDQAKFPVHTEWYALASGGQGPHFIAATDRGSWAEFAGPEKSMSKALDETLGARKATELIDAIREATTSTYSEVLLFRPDMSYLPGK